MRARIALALAVLFGTAALHAQSAADVQRQFIGNWRLVSFEQFDEKGAGRPSAYTGGRIMYDTAGHMAAQLTYSNRKPLSTPSTEAERAAAYQSFLSYYAKYSIDPAAKTVTHHVEGSTNPNWASSQINLVRWYEFSPDGNRLMLSTKNDAGRVTGTLTWERIRQ
ncbi:MAG TPA: lipocalin-like domain-containing protein [Vicinamibacterales bacterium]|nr:lipocalin-like domain-containing protein [Vicinamibacterales bacterium]